MRKYVYSLLVIVGIVFLSACSQSYDTEQKSLPITVSSKEHKDNATEIQQSSSANINTANQVSPSNNYDSCGQDYYENTDGVCVHDPSDNPQGATARCGDGTYSYSQHRQGTCSRHGGVSEWL